jgi:hypothetical protein
MQLKYFYTSFNIMDYHAAPENASLILFLSPLSIEDCENVDDNFLQVKTYITVEA